MEIQGVKQTGCNPPSRDGLEGFLLLSKPNLSRTERWLKRAGRLGYRKDQRLRGELATARSFSPCQRPQESKEDPMKKAAWRLCLLLVLAVLIAAPVGAAGHGRRDAKKVGILLVAFGSSEASAQVSFDNIERAVKAAYPDLPLRWAYTSSIIRAKLAKQGRLLDSPETALAKMQDEGFSHVAVQSLHTIAGEEFDDLRQVVTGFRMMGQMTQIELGAPLLGTQADMARAVDGILRIIPAQRQPRDAVLLMGHGTPHPSNAFYAALMFQVQRRDSAVISKQGCRQFTMLD